METECELICDVTLTMSDWGSVLTAIGMLESHHYHVRNTEPGHPECTDMIESLDRARRAIVQSQEQEIEKEELIEAIIEACGGNDPETKCKCHKCHPNDIVDDYEQFKMLEDR
jgi:hypothetical protein